MSMHNDMWSYRENAWTQGGSVLTETTGVDLTGLSVEATDGGIGKVDEATNEVGASYIVVDTGPWIFGKKVMLPAGVVESVDLDTETVYVNRTKDEIKDAPEYDDMRRTDTAYRDELGTYYGGRRESDRTF
jgi:hypothetical protein